MNSDESAAHRYPRSSVQARQPGSVAEIEASTDGPKVGAFFDFDGTLIAGYSAAVFSGERLRNREVGLSDLLTLGRAILDAGLGQTDFDRMIGSAGEMWKGRTDEDLMELGQRLYDQKISDRVYPELRELVRAHQRKGHSVVLCSSATRYQVMPMANALGVDDVICTELEMEDGILTGRLAKQAPWGPHKARAVQRFAEDHGVDMGLSYFYADGDEDVSLMHLVGNPRPTNPGRKLAAVAERRGWPILRFTSRGPTTPDLVVRNLAGMAAMVPVGIGAAAVGLLNRDKERGVNLGLSMWLDFALGFGGVRMNVIGEENLWKQRPAVFIFNHRNNFDALMTANLIRSDWTGVGKKEAARDPISRNVGKLMNAAFIDRSDTNSAVEALKPVEEVARKGYSILMSPEGSRSRTGELLPFKKGPFRIAMAVGIPLVPIVFRNADQVGSRGAMFMRPGTVDVAVLPPVQVDDWTLEDLPERIEGVRQIFLDTLANWPD